MIETASIRVLLVEDEAGDAYLVKMGLKQAQGIDFSVVWAESLIAAKRELSSVQFDVILLDLSLPDSEGLTTIQKARQFTGDTPIVVLTGRSDMDFALTALEAGASDYMVKGDFGFDGLARVIRYALLRVEMEAHNKLLVAALEAAASGIVITDKDASIKWANPAFSRLTGYSLEESIGRKPNELVKSGAQESPFYHSMWEKLLVGKHWRGEIINKRKDGSLYHEELSVSPVKNSRGEITHYIGIKEDITRRKAMEETLQKLANTDPLTGLSNRRVFLERLIQESGRIMRLSSPAALLMLDLDYFKRVNDTYGHATGDAVLKCFADILQHNSRNIDLAARLGGEEFAVLLTGANKEEAMEVAGRLRHQVESAEVAHEKGVIKITVSIGAAALSGNDLTGEIALRHADIALFAAKERGRNQICWFGDMKSDPAL